MSEKGVEWEGRVGEQKLGGGAKGGGMSGKELGVLKEEMWLWDPLKNYTLISLERWFSVLIELILPS